MALKPADDLVADFVQSEGQAPVGVEPLARVGYREFQTLVDRNLHWDAPSHFEIFSDGTWFGYISHVANMRRLGGPIDTGGHFSWFVRIQYLDANGGILLTKDYVLELSLGYKQQKSDVTRRGVDADVQRIASRIVSLKWFRGFKYED